jgi:hypothetical protein
MNRIREKAVHFNFDSAGRHYRSSIMRRNARGLTQTKHSIRRLEPYVLVDRRAGKTEQAGRFRDIIAG